MTFYVQKTWEQELPLIFRIDMPDTMQFPVVQTPLAGIGIFIVEVAVGRESEETSRIDRYLFSDTDSALSAIKDIETVRISFLAPRYYDDDGAYSVSDIVEIYEGKDTYGQRATVLVCQNDQRYCICCDDNAEDELTNLQLIYCQKNNFQRQV